MRGKRWGGKKLEKCVAKFKRIKDCGYKSERKWENWAGRKAEDCTGASREMHGSKSSLHGGRLESDREIREMWTVFSTERVFFGCFSGKSARKWVPCGEVDVGFCTTARNGRLFGGEFRRGFVQTVPVSLRPSALFCGRSSLSVAWPLGSCPASGCSPRESGRCPRSCGPPERC